MNENELRRLIYSSPEKGYRQLFEQYHGYAFAIVYRTLGGVGSQKDAEDCIVDIFADVIMNYDTAAEGSLQAYIGTTARNKAINLKRSLTASSWYTVSEEEAGNIPDGGTGVEERVENSHTLRLVLDKIDELGEPDSTIVIHKYFFERSSREIAQTVGMTSAAVRMRLSRALKRLRKVLTELDVTL